MAESPTFLLSKGKDIAASKDSNAEYEIKAAFIFLTFHLSGKALRKLRGPKYSIQVLGFIIGHIGSQQGYQCNQ